MTATDPATNDDPYGSIASLPEAIAIMKELGKALGQEETRRRHDRIAGAVLVAVFVVVTIFAGFVITELFHQDDVQAIVVEELQAQNAELQRQNAKLENQADRLTAITVELCDGIKGSRTSVLGLLAFQFAFDNIVTAEEQARLDSSTERFGPNTVEC